MRDLQFRRIAIATCLLLALPTWVAAQQARRRWSLTFYGAASQLSQSTAGQPLAQFPVGDTFVTEDGPVSRHHSSWRFGDGSALFNAAVAQFAALDNVAVPPIVPLDDVLRKSGARSGVHSTFGIKIAREVTPTLSVSLMIERGGGGLSVSDEMTRALQQSSDSFTNAFKTLLGSAPVIGLTADSTVTTSDVAQSHLRVIGAVSRTLWQQRRLSIRGSLGGGVQRSLGEATEVTVNGSYQFSLYNVYPFVERDEVRIRFEEPGSSWLGMAGVSAIYDVSPTLALAFDLRADLVANGVTTTVETRPFIQSSTFGAFLPTNTTPALQFSNQSSPTSSLRAGVGSALRTFSGSGTNTQFHFSFGVVTRF